MPELDRICDVMADAPDSRDRLYAPPLISLRRRIEPWRDGKAGWWSDGRVRDQGRNPSCVGHAMATVIDHLRARTITEDNEHAERETLDLPWVSWRMLYETARFHDQWSGENYPGTSLRGGLKGFFYNGVCSLEEERKLGLGEDADPAASTWYMTKELADLARTIQLGAYYRICPRLPDMHAALNEAGVIVASAYVHQGWSTPAGARIPFDVNLLQGGVEPLSNMHAFAIVGYNDEGFWIQNSWGPDWGASGRALWAYADWAATFCDAWVMRLAVLPPKAVGCNLGRLRAYSPFVNRAETHFFGKEQRDFSAPSRLDVLGHMIPFRDGMLDQHGPYNVNCRTLIETFKLIREGESANAPRTAPKPPTPRKRKTPFRYHHVLLYFMGGWSDESELAAQLAEISPIFREHDIYPLFFIWETALFRELAAVIKRTIEAVRLQSENMSDRRRNPRDRLIEERLSVPANRVLRELRCGARRMFAVDNPDPDALQTVGPDAEALLAGRLPGGQVNAAFCLNELFLALKDRYRAGDMSFHLAAHGFGAQVLTECIANADRFVYRPVIETCTLISPLVALDRVQRDILPAVAHKNEGRISRRLADSSGFHLERLDLYLLSEIAMKLDRFSDDYSGAWPELWTRILAKSQHAYGRCEQLPGTSENVMPLLAIERDAVRADGIRDLNIDIVSVSASEDEADSSLHHDISMSRQILARLVNQISGRSEQERPHLFGRPARGISFQAVTQEFGQ